MKATEVYKDRRIGGMDSNLERYWTQWVAAGCRDYLPRDQRVFEVGSGTGNTVKTLKKLNNYVVGSDASNRTVKDIKSVADAALLLDISDEKAPYPDGDFDAVCCFEVLEHLANPYSAVNEMKRLCKIGGYIHISIPDYEQQFGYAGHQHAFVYPGLFKVEYFRVFLRQMFLKIVFEQHFQHATALSERTKGNKEAALHYYFVCKNVETKRDILEVVASDIEESEVYKQVDGL